jgi:hypothetical protein
MKKLAEFMLIPILLLALVSVWWLVPSKMVRINPEDVLKIKIFNGNNGKEIVITERSEIDHIINNIKSISFRKGKISIGYMGYSFRTTIYKSNGSVYKTFIINSEDTIRKDPFFYRDSTGSIDYNFIKDLFENNIK